MESEKNEATTNALTAHTLRAPVGTPQFTDIELSTSRLTSMDVTETTPVEIRFEGITYCIEAGSKKKEQKAKVILKELNGSIRAGTVTAIMGPTGSGKTSLLNVLANRMPVTKNSTLRGRLLINGRSLDAPGMGRKFARLSAYVMQEDVMNAFLTVRETLALAANFQLPPSVGPPARADLVHAVISELGLNKVADTMLGNASVRGVSGGERKRANIGVELIKNPSALFLDEPTSGLDSFQAQSVMACLSGLAVSGRTVVASIHQPRSSIFALFDQLYLISEGRAMFAGPAADAVDYFTRIDPRYACPALFNPADWFLDVTSPDYRSAEREKESLARIDTLEATWLEAAAEDGGGSSSGSGGDEGAAAAAAAAAAAEEEPLPTYQSSFLTQVSLVGWRSGVAVLRNKGALAAKIVPSLFFALVLGAVYSGVGNDQKAIQDRIGALFFFAINQTFGNMFGVLNTFSEEKIVVERERASKSYRLSAFYLGKLVAELPLNLVSPLVFGAAVYWLVGLNDLPGRFFTFLVLLVLTGLTAISLGMCVASAAPNKEVAMAAAPIVVVLMILFGGFYVNVESLPVWLAWVQYLSIMRWTFMGLVVNEFKGATFSCSDVDVAAGDTCVTSGDETIRRLSFGGETVEDAMLGLFCMIVGLNILAYIFLRLSKKTYQKIKPK